MAAGGQIAAQVHYNLLGGIPVRTVPACGYGWLLPATTSLKALRTMLLPAPVELPCTPDRARPAV